MPLLNEFPVVSSNLKAGLGVYGTADPFNVALPNAGALNPVGSVWVMPAPSESGSALGFTAAGAAPSAGYGAELWVRYVLYRSTSNPAVVAGPAPVYWTDESFTTVTGKASEALIASKSVSVAGWLLPNSGTGTNGLGTTLFTNTILNNGGSLSPAAGGSYVFIAIKGFLPSAYVASATAGQWLYAAGDFTPTGVAADGATTYSDFRNIGTVVSTPGSNLADVWVPNLL